MAKRKGNGRGYLGVYRTYNFINKDPAIDALRTIINDEGVSEAKLHVLSGVSVTTFTGWFRGDTKRPQHATLAAAASALGYDYELRKKKVVDIDAELLKGQAWLDKQKERKAKG